MTSTKEKEKEEKEAKKRKRLADDFYNLLGTIQEITESSKWEDCKQILEERREKLPSDKENFLKEVFDKHITELKEKEKEEKKRRDDRVSVSVSASDSQCIEVILRCLATYGDGLGPHELNDGGVLATVIAAGFKVLVRHVLESQPPFPAFNNASVPPSTQATFPYIFAVSKFMQSGTYDLVGTIIYEIDQSPYQSTFYNGTFEVTEAGGIFSVESVFLFFLGIAPLVLLVILVYWTLVFGNPPLLGGIL